MTVNDRGMSSGFICPAEHNDRRLRVLQAKGLSVHIETSQIVRK